MDVNTIGNNVNSIKVYSANNRLPQYSDENIVVNKNLVPSNTKQNDKIQENKEGFDKKDLDKAVKKLNKFLEDENTHAEYSIHKELGTTMIKIVDDDTKKIILELPSEKILDMVASMCEQVGLIDKKA